MNEEVMLQERWRRQETLHVDGIVFLTGRVVLLIAQKASTGTRTFCAAAPFADTTAGSVVGYDADAWVPLSSTESVELGDGARLLAGEGAMGNEGFVALERQGELERHPRPRYTSQPWAFPAEIPCARPRRR